MRHAGPRKGLREADVATRCNQLGLVRSVSLTLACRRFNDTLAAVQRDMDMMMGQFLGPDVMRSLAPLMPPLPVGSSPAAGGMASSLGPVDVEETDKSYIVSAEVPGFSKDDLKASLSPDGVLTLRGEHTEQEEKGEKQKSRRMKFSQSFNRR